MGTKPNPAWGNTRSQITRSAVMRILTAGFALVILSLVAAGFFALKNIRSIQSSIENLEQSQTETADLIAALEDEQTTLSAVFYRLSGNPETLDREALLAQLDRSAQQIRQMSSGFSGKSDEGLWRELEIATTAFASEARRLLALEGEETLLSRDLLRRHNEVVGIVSRLSETSHKRALEAQHQIRVLAQSFLRSAGILLGSSLLLALACAIFVVQITGRLFRKMEWQTSELSRVSWHLLQKQEEIARRFSHELHDELGQCLTALKTNVASMAPEAPPGPERLQAILHLLDGAIGNARQLSQLLRPTILDDFGLDASLRWLTENFSKHTGLEVRYHSDFTGRLPEQTETHLFRIAQEALTNVAKHSKATHVDVELRWTRGAVSLSIQDNGQGLPFTPAQERRNGLGLIGMRARARAMDGELKLLQPPAGGVRVEVRAPIDKGEEP